jgi:RNA polymerase sigma-70 factor (ECF subfamily)
VEDAAAPDDGGSSPWAGADERVAMLFGCCHPALAVEVRLALTLRSVAGLTTEQVARAFLVPEATLAQRIVRAKRKIVANGIRMEVPATRMPERLDDVLTVVYLTYNAGFVDAGFRGLAHDAVWLAELVTAGLPQEPEAWGLLALLTLQQSRAAARFGPRGELVLLADQDRSRWDHPAIVRAERYLERAALWRRPGRFQLQAAIAACHASAPTYAETDWLQILTLYDLLLRYDRSPVVRLNRAVALAECVGPEPALEEVEALGGQLDAYHLWHATRADLLRRLGRFDAATAANQRAFDLAAVPAERALLRDRLGT